MSDDLKNDVAAAPPEQQPPSELGMPTGGVDVLGRQLLVGDVVMLAPTELSVYSVRSSRPVLDPNLPPNARHLVLDSRIDPLVSPGHNIVPVIKISSGPQLREERRVAAMSTPRLVQP